MKASWMMGLALFACANMVAADEVILDDLVVEGSLCVGLDCVEGEVFGFDTIRIKENNTRIMFQDTSSSSQFPSNDWQITVNDSNNGGDSFFAISDCGLGDPPTEDNSALCGEDLLEFDANDPENPILIEPRYGNRVFLIEAGAPEGTFVVTAEGSVLINGSPIGDVDLGNAIARIEELEILVVELQELLAIHTHTYLTTKGNPKSKQEAETSPAAFVP